MPQFERFPNELSPRQAPFTRHSGAKAKANGELGSWAGSVLSDGAVRPLSLESFNICQTSLRDAPVPFSASEASIYSVTKLSNDHA